MQDLPLVPEAFESIALSFEHGRPVWDVIPCKVHMILAHQNQHRPGERWKYAAVEHSLGVWQDTTVNTTETAKC